MSLDSIDHEYINKQWDENLVPLITEAIKIPNLSPAFDPDCLTNGLQEKCLDLMVTWMNKNMPAGGKLEVFTQEGVTPIILAEIPAFQNGTGHMLAYAHADKQPPMTGWKVTTPYEPVIKQNYGSPCLYGRGGADDIYGGPAALVSLNALQKANLPHGKVTVLIEFCEESGSKDLPGWIEKLMEKYLKTVDFVLCLDSGTPSYEQFALTDALRGVAMASIHIETLSGSIHSGIGGGVCPDPMRIFRLLLERAENTQTGEVKIPALNVKIPDSVVKNLLPLRDVPQKEFLKQFNFLDSTKPPSDDNVELALNSTWRSSMTVIGYDTLPTCEKAGNVIREKATMKVSFRLPPTADPNKVAEEIKSTFEADPPYGVKVTVDPPFVMGGWVPPVPLAPWLDEACQSASETIFKKKYIALGCGGSIPFMGMLGNLFPNAQFVICGLLGPESSAHGPDEFLHINYGKGLTSCITRIIAEHSSARAKGL